jgi:hypothetical protein
MSHFSYGKWCEEKRFNCFKVIDKKIYCSICKSVYKENKFKGRYVSKGATPPYKRCLSDHLKSKILFRAKGCVASVKKRNREKKKKKKVHSKTSIFKRNSEINSNQNPILEKRKNSSEFLKSSTQEQTVPEADLSSKDENLTGEDKALIPVIKDKLLIVMHMIKSNTSNNSFVSLQDLIDNIDSNLALKVFEHSSSKSFFEFVNTLYKSYKAVIQDSIKRFKYYGIMCDDSVCVWSKSNEHTYKIHK